MGKKTVKKDRKPKKTEKSEDKTFFLRGDFRQFSNKNFHNWDHFFSLLFPKDSESLKILDIRLREVGAKRPFNGTSKVKKVREKKLFLRGDFRKFLNKNVHVWDHFFPLLFPKDSESLKILDIRLWEVGAKRRLNGTSKVDRHTDRRTDRRTDKSTYRKHRPRGPMLWKLVRRCETEVDGDACKASYGSKLSQVLHCNAVNDSRLNISRTTLSRIKTLDTKYLIIARSANRFNGFDCSCPLMPGHCGWQSTPLETILTSRRLCRSGQSVPTGLHQAIMHWW